MWLLLLFFPFVIFAQTGIKGVVKDKTGLPIAGATVTIKGTKLGATTDFDGNFSMNLPSSPATIVVKNTGYQNKTIEVKSGGNYNIILEESENVLATVNIGYSKKAAKDLTGSIASIKMDETKAIETPNIESILQGQTAGVNVTKGNGPGDAASVNIRGVGSLTGSTQPLYVIDGIVMDTATESISDPLFGSSSTGQNGLVGVDPADIVDIQVLKDASATAIYGSLGANGVIIITTKQGKKGGLKVSYNTSATVGESVGLYKMLSTEDYVKLQNQKHIKFGDGSQYFYEPDGKIREYRSAEDDNAYYSPVDWADKFYRNTDLIKHKLSLSGGTNKFKYLISGSYEKNNGIIKNVFSEDYNATAKLRYEPSKKLQFGLTTGYYNSLSGRTAVSNNQAGPTRSIYKNITIGAPLQADLSNLEFTRSLQDYELGPTGFVQDYDDIFTDHRYIGAFDVRYNIQKNIRYNGKIGVDYRDSDRLRWDGLGIQVGYENNGRAGYSYMDRLSYNIDNTVDFLKLMKGKHDLDVTAGIVYNYTNNQKISYAAEQFNATGIANRGKDFLKNIYNYGRPEFGGQILYSYPFDESAAEAILSGLTRVNYSFLKKYLFTGTMRADGSSKFLGKNKWGYFPSASLAWKVNEESFLKSVSEIDLLKVRLGYGASGNQRIQPNRIFQTYNYNNAGYSNGDGIINAALQYQNIPNPNLKWETITQLNTGLDLTMWGGKMNFTADAYIKESKDLLNDLRVGGSAGVSKYLINRGSLTNRGLEFSLNGDVIKNKKWNLNLYGNIAFNKTKIGDLGLEKSQFGEDANGNPIEYRAYLGSDISLTGNTTYPVNLFAEGMEVGLFYGFQTDGIVKPYTEVGGVLVDNADPSKTYAKVNGLDPEVGIYNYVDQNKDGLIDDNDKRIIGNPNPDFTYGFGSKLSYKDLSLSMNFNGTHGFDIFNANYLFETNSYQYDVTNIRQSAYDNMYDEVTNPNGTSPGLLTAAVGKKQIESAPAVDKFVSDGSFLRLQSVVINYNVPVKKMKGIDALNVSVSGNNLLLFTKYEGYDPELSAFRFDGGVMGVDISSAPRQRTYTIGVGVTF